jgi:tetratricopeptide (TPR) repeat protein
MASLPGSELSSEPSNATFISYRRDVGGILAMALYQYLTEHRVDAFYDIESLRAGQFDTILLNQVAARPYFVLVLTPGTLDRCVDDRDWVRREIEQALTTRRVIVPVHTPNFDFGDLGRFLPAGLGQEVQRFNGQELPQKWFKFAVQQLVEEFLLPIRTETVAPPAAEQAIVERLHREAQAAPAVTEEQLSAQEYFERALARPDGDADGRIADYDAVLRLDPQYVAAFNNRGAARRQAGDLEGAIADFDEALRLDPRDAEVLNNRGSVRGDLGDVDGAFADLDEALRLDPQYAKAYYNRGSTRAAAGDPEGAIADFDEALRLDPRYGAAFNNRGSMRVAKGDPEGAIADFDEALRLDPADPEVRFNRGIARAAAGDPAGAIADFDEALRMDPHDADAYLNRGLARRDSGDLEGAIADMERGASLAPEDEDLSRALDELRKQG